MFRLDEITRALAVMAHPDDVDFSAAGLVAQLTDAGAEVTYCLVSDGQAGGYDRVIERTTQRIVVGKVQVSILFNYSINSRKMGESAVQSVTARRSARDVARSAGPARENSKTRRFKKT